MADETTAALKISIEASLKDFSSKMGEFEKILRGTEEQVKKTGTGFGELFASFSLADMATKALYKLKDIARESIQEYDEEILVLTRLKSSLGEDYKAIEEFAEAQEKSTRFAHDDILAASNSLAIHKLNREEMEQLLPVIMDYATKSGRDATSTAEAFGRAIEYGSTRGLRPFGIQIDKTGSQLDVFKALVKAGEGNVKGLSQAVADIGAGPMVQLENRLKAQQEELGKNLMPVWQAFGNILQFTIIPLVQGLLFDFKLVSSAIVGFSAGIGAIFTKGKGLKAFGSEMQAAFDYALKQQMGGKEEIPGKTTTKTGSGLGTTDRGRVKKEVEDPAIKEAERALSLYKTQIEQSQMILDAMRERREVDIEEYYADKKLLTEEVGQAELDALVKQMGATKDLTKLEELKDKYIEQQTKNETELLRIEIEKEKALKDNVELQRKAAAVLERVHLEEETFTEGQIRDPVKKLQMQQQKQMAMMRKTHEELLALEKKGLIKTDELKKYETLMEKQESENRKAIRRSEMEYKLSLASQEAGNLAQIAQGLFELTGSKNLALFQLAKQFSAIQSIMNTAQAVTKALAEGGPIMGPIMAVTIGMLGAIQIAKIESQEPPKAAKGGYIVGASHSGGGVDINAEGGEYMQSRAAVSRYGVTAMEAINRGMVSPAALNSLVRAGTAKAGMSAMTAGSSKYTIVNFIDPSTFRRFLATPEGKSAIQNHISDNSFSIKQALGAI